MKRAVKEAERRFQTGKAFALEGRAAEARTEFDAALETLFAVSEDDPDRGVAERKFEELARLIHRYDLENLDSSEVGNVPVFVESPLPKILDLTFPVDPDLKNRSIQQVQASKSELPLTVNEAVLSYINYFSSTRGQKTLLYGLRRAGRYHTMIQRVLDEEGVPQELIYLAQAESAFMPRAVSRKAAAGMWQFVKWRGNEYGLKQTTYLDDRLDPEKATRAAARHLRDLYDQFGDWYLAMAAYNCGPGCVDRAVQRTGYADFWELRRRGSLPKETANYVPAILGMAIVSKDLAAYGIPRPQADPEEEFDTLTLTATTSVALLADAADRPQADIRELNPSLLRSIAPAGVEVKVPLGTAPVVTAALESIPADRRVAWRLHRVEQGDTLPMLAKRYATAPDSILAANERTSAAFLESAQHGETLLIPAKAQPDPAPKAARSRKSKSRTQVARGAQKPAGQAVRVAQVKPRTHATNR